MIGDFFICLSLAPKVKQNNRIEENLFQTICMRYQFFAYKNKIIVAKICLKSQTSLYLPLSLIGKRCQESTYFLKFYPKKTI